MAKRLMKKNDKNKQRALKFWFLFRGEHAPPGREKQRSFNNGKLVLTLHKSGILLK